MLYYYIIKIYYNPIDSLKETKQHRKKPLHINNYHFDVPKILGTSKQFSYCATSSKHYSISRST